MTDDKDFKLRSRESGGDKAGKTILQVSAAVLLIALTILVLQVVGMMSGGDSGGGLSEDELESLALRLERQGLSGPAARAWTDYLTASGVSGDKGARIWYRIGTIHQEAGVYEDALDAYYRSESFASSDERRYRDAWMNVLNPSGVLRPCRTSASGAPRRPARIIAAGMCLPRSETGRSRGATWTR